MAMDAGVRPCTRRRLDPAARPSIPAAWTALHPQGALRRIPRRARSQMTAATTSHIPPLRSHATG